MIGRTCLIVAVLGLLLSAGPARAGSLADLAEEAAAAGGAGADLPATFGLSGYLRTRGELLHNLDLDRGPDARGVPLFPVSFTDPARQTLTHGDLRLRADLHADAPGGLAGVRIRVDVLDNLVLGSTPEGAPPTGRAPLPAASPGQRPPAGAFRIRRAYGQAVTPVGVLAAGRMGHHWGLGMLAHGGDAPDADGGDAADRIAFVTPLFGHLVAAAYDVTAVGPFADRRDGRRALDLDPADDVRTVSFAVMNHRTALARERRRAAGRPTVEYGLLASRRWQEMDVPGWWLPTAGHDGGGQAAAMHRGYRATVGDVFVRVTLPAADLAAEVAVLDAMVAQPSLVPGVELRSPVRSRAWGAAVESAFGPPGGALRAGLDAGFASGDPAPGFGAFPEPGAPRSPPGSLDGPQAEPPFDDRADNFRFHPDYRIDRILFREIVGTVTDAMYLRPHVRWRIVSFGERGELVGRLAVVASRAVHASSTPGSAAPLGIEVDPTLSYVTTEGLSVHLEHAVLFPLAGLDNPALGLTARPAQLLRLRLTFLF